MSTTVTISTAFGPIYIGARVYGDGIGLYVAANDQREAVTVGGTRAELLDALSRATAAVEAFPSVPSDEDPEPRFVFGDIPPHPFASEDEEAEAAGMHQYHHGEEENRR